MPVLDRLVSIGTELCLGADAAERSQETLYAFLIEKSKAIILKSAMVRIQQKNFFGVKRMLKVKDDWHQNSK